MRRATVLLRSLANSHESSSLRRYKIVRGVGFKYAGPRPKYRNWARCPTVTRAYSAASRGVNNGSDRVSGELDSTVLIRPFGTRQPRSRKRTVIP